MFSLACEFLPSMEAARSCEKIDMQESHVDKLLILSIILLLVSLGYEFQSSLREAAMLTSF
jgi:hypothetical protein